MDGTLKSAADSGFELTDDLLPLDNRRQNPNRPSAFPKKSEQVQQSR
jgi:hypothetical protein